MQKDSTSASCTVLRPAPVAASRSSRGRAARGSEGTGGLAWRQIARAREKGRDGESCHLERTLTPDVADIGKKNVGASRPLVTQRHKRRKRQCAGRAIDVN